MSCSLALSSRVNQPCADSNVCMQIAGSFEGQTLVVLRPKPEAIEKAKTGQIEVGAAQKQNASRRHSRRVKTLFWL